ncbi:AMP-binding protein [Variovorax boronicumulans]|uniref:AMP-binding protein n=1 Tax=Variovorax boronicumulans TaxID=436515 RepID=UPI001C597C86
METPNKLAAAAPEARQDVSGWRVRDDATAARHYRASGQWSDRTIWAAACEAAAEQPERIAVIDGDHAYTTRQVVGAARSLAASLHAMGLRPGDVISYQLPNWWECAVINLAACAAGLVCNPIVPIYREAEVRYILRDARSRVFFVPQRFRNFDYAAMATGLRGELGPLAHIVVVRPQTDEIDGLRFDALLQPAPSDAWHAAAQHADAVKLLLYTSGTTGSPKGVLHSHNTLMSEVRAVMQCWRVDRHDVVIMPSPVTHVTGYLYGLEMPFVARAQVVLMERWDAKEAADLVDRHRATLTVGATPFLAELAQQAAARGGLPSLRVFASGGAPVPPELVRRARRAFGHCKVFRVYGSSEAPTITLGRVEGDGDEQGATTDGRIVNNEVRIGDPGTGAALAEGCEGEVLVRGPELMLGYTQWSHTLEAFDADGYFRTGDLAFVDTDGFMTISGRKKDLIIRGGENISAKEIEDVLHAHASIAEAAIVAMPHPRLGEGVCAFVIPAADHLVDLEHVTALLAAAGLARQKYPERVELVRELPRTASGKVQKNLLRDRIRATLAGEAATAPATPSQD